MDSSLRDIARGSCSIHCHISRLLCSAAGVIALRQSFAFVAASGVALVSAEVEVGCSSRSDQAAIMQLNASLISMLFLTFRPNSV